MQHPYWMIDSPDLQVAFLPVQLGPLEKLISFS